MLYVNHISIKIHWIYESRQYARVCFSPTCLDLQEVTYGSVLFDHTFCVLKLNWEIIAKIIERAFMPLVCWVLKRTHYFIFRCNFYYKIGVKHVCLQFKAPHFYMHYFNINLVYSFKGYISSVKLPLSIFCLWLLVWRIRIFKR